MTSAIFATGPAGIPEISDHPRLVTAGKDKTGKVGDRRWIAPMATLQDRSAPAPPFSISGAGEAEASVGTQRSGENDAGTTSMFSCLTNMPRVAGGQLPSLRDSSRMRARSFASL